MKFERKHYIYIMITIILSIIAISGEVSNNDLNNKYNKTNETDYLETPRIYYQSGSTNNYLTLNSGSVLAWLINNSITTNKIELQISKVKLYSDLDMNNHNLTNCLNCNSETDNLSWQNSKVNISGDNITGDINILNAYFNVTTNKTFYLDFNALPNMMRNATVAYRTAPLATINLLLKNSNGIGNGGGPALIFWNKGNDSENNTESNLGRIALVWGNKTGNESRMDTYLRHGSTDTTGLSPAYSVYVSPKTLTNTSSTQNYTLETGNLKLTNKTGTGYEFACFDSDGNLIRSSVSCDLI